MFGERTRDCSPGHAGKEGPQLARRGTATPEHRPQRPAGSTHSSTRGLRPPEQLERPAGLSSSDKTRPDSPVPATRGQGPNQSPGLLHSSGHGRGTVPFTSWLTAILSSSLIFCCSSCHLSTPTPLPPVCSQQCKPVTSFFDLLGQPTLQLQHLPPPPLLKFQLLQSHSVPPTFSHLLLLALPEMLFSQICILSFSSQICLLFVF